MKQRCYLINIYLNWILYIGGFVYLVVSGRLPFGIFWIFWLPFGLWLYIRWFPTISHLFGYGRVEDTNADEVKSSSETVNLYTAIGCPFCPIVTSRLEKLKIKMGFELNKVDVTLNPELLRRKGITAVPVVEVQDRLLTGNLTTLQLSKLIIG